MTRYREDFDCPVSFSFFFNDTATTEIYTLSLHDALPILLHNVRLHGCQLCHHHRHFVLQQDRKSTRLNSSHVETSYAVFCLKKKNMPEGLRVLIATGETETARRIAGEEVAPIPTLFTRQVLARAALAVFFFNDTATTEIYTLSLHDALPI